MPRRTDLPAALKKFGADEFGPIELVPGWATNGDSAFNPKGAVGHHTAGPRTGDRPSLRVCVEGRPDLPGPLCNTFLARSGVCVVVAAGRANHAGPGGFRGLVGNSAVWGTEAEDDGTDGIWTREQRIIYPRINAAYLWLSGRDESWYCGHKDWTTRKIDPVGIDTAWMRRQIAAEFARVLHPKPNPKPEEDVVASKEEVVEALLNARVPTWLDRNRDGKLDEASVGSAIGAARTDAYEASRKASELAAVVARVEAKLDQVLAKLTTTEG
jgi:hypothetical protein